MYRIQTLPRNVLITVDEVVAMAAIDENADLRYLTNSIIIAEERFVAPALGNGMYEAMLKQKNVAVTAGNRTALLVDINASLARAGKNAITEGNLPEGITINAMELMEPVYQELWKQYLWKICADAVVTCSIVPSWMRTSAQGQTYNNPKVLTSENLGSASGEKKDIEFKWDHMNTAHLSPLIDRMKQWICQKGWYPLYADCGCGQEAGISSRPGGIISGLYDNDERPRRRKAYVQPATAAPAPRERTCTIKVTIRTVPDPDLLYPLCNRETINKEYPAGRTLTIPHLAGKNILWPIFIDDAVITDIPYDITTGTFDNYPNNFFDTNKVLINYSETS